MSIKDPLIVLILVCLVFLLQQKIVSGIRSNKSGYPGYSGNPADKQDNSEDFATGWVINSPNEASPKTETSWKTFKGVAPSWPTRPSPTPGYSPVTLYAGWSRNARVLCLFLCGALGSFFNLIFCAAFFVEEKLRKAGNVFLMCTGMSDLLVTLLLFPTAAVVILAEDWDTMPVCEGLYFIGKFATYCYTGFYLMVGIVSYLRHCRTRLEYKRVVTKAFVAASSVGVACVSAVMAVAAVFLQLDEDYCQRQHRGSSLFKLSSFFLWHFIPSVITINFFYISSKKIRNQILENVHTRRYHNFDHDESLVSIHMITYILYILSWTPFSYVSFYAFDATDNNYYQSALTGLCRPIISTAVYSMANPSFRDAFLHNCQYFFCKMALSLPFYRRRRRQNQNLPLLLHTETVSNHILRLAMDATTPQERYAAAVAQLNPPL